MWSAAVTRCAPPAQVSDKADPSQLVSLIAALNPNNTPGRLAVIVRMGAQKVPPGACFGSGCVLVQGVQRAS